MLSLLLHGPFEPHREQVDQTIAFLTADWSDAMVWLPDQPSTADDAKPSPDASDR